MTKFGKVNSYVVHGLNFRSEFPLPELMKSSDPPEVEIRIREIEDLPSEITSDGNWFRTSHSEAFFIWNDVGAFRVRDGTEIIIDPKEGVNEEFLRMFLLGSVMGMLLQQRGRFPLHASTVVMNGKAVAFTGESGIGKSTLVSALHQKGYEIVADDVTAIDMEAGLPIVFPGIPKIKLWPESAEAFDDDAENLPRLHPESEKRVIRIDKGITSSVYSLGRIYVLAEDEEISIESISPQERIMEMIRNCYNSKIIHDALGGGAFMKKCAQLASSSGIYRLRRKSKFSMLSDLVKKIEEHVALED